MIVAHLNIPLVQVKLELVLHFGAALLEGRHSLWLAGSAPTERRSWNNIVPQKLRVRKAPFEMEQRKLDKT